MQDAPASTDTNQDSEEPVRKFRDRVVEAMRSGDPERYASLFAEDAVVMPRDGKPITGADRIQEWAKGLFDAFEPHPNVAPMETRRFSERWALDWGRYKSVYEPRGGGEPVHVDETYLWLFRKNDRGDWKLSRIIWNGNGPSTEGG